MRIQWVAKVNGQYTFIKKITTVNLLENTEKEKKKVSTRMEFSSNFKETEGRC